MVAYSDYEKYPAKTRFIIILIVAVVMVGIAAYIIGFQQGSVTTNAVNNTKETEQPTYIERNSEIAPVRYSYDYPTYYYTYNYESPTYYSYNRNYCSQWLAEAYRTGCTDP
jgi:hypothetical protein